MSNSLSSNLIVVNRKPTLQNEIEEKLSLYLSTVNKIVVNFTQVAIIQLQHPIIVISTF